MLKRLTKQVGEITDTMGRFAEQQVCPKLFEMFYGKGIFLKEMYSNVKLKEDDKLVVQIDHLLSILYMQWWWKLNMPFATKI